MLVALLVYLVQVAALVSPSHLRLEQFALQGSFVRLFAPVGLSLGSFVLVSAPFYRSRWTIVLHLIRKVIAALF